MTAQGDYEISNVPLEPFSYILLKIIYQFPPSYKLIKSE